MPNCHNVALEATTIEAERQALHTAKDNVETAMEALEQFLRLSTDPGCAADEVYGLLDNVLDKLYEGHRLHKALKHHLAKVKDTATTETEQGD